jgi:benzil reductase ((S)-benzoin forming)
MQIAFVSGVSTGIGWNLANQLLTQGYRVYGVSRRAPIGLIDHPQFRFCSIDFSEGLDAELILRNWIRQENFTQLSHLFLNVGTFGQRIATVHQHTVSALNNMMHINLWSHKLVLDSLLENKIAIDAAVFSSSIAGVRMRAGNSGYAITKAALNAMAKLYALEYPNIHFLVMGLCNVETHLSQTIGALPLEAEFPDIVKLRERAATASYLVSAEQRARDILSLFESKQYRSIPSGDFVEIRNLLAN